MTADASTPESFHMGSLAQPHPAKGKSHPVTQKFWEPEEL